MTDLTDLIQRLESAEQGSRELDARILWAANRPWALSGYWNAATGKPTDVVREMTFDQLPSSLGKRGIEAVSKDYTTSIDDALTLVPEGWWPYAIYFGQDGEGPCEAIVFQRRERCKIGGGYSYSTPALALCVAALKARAQ